MSGISGHIQGLEIAISAYNGVVIEGLREHEVALQQCLKVCTSAVDAAPASTNDTIKHMKAYSYARQMVANNIGDAKESSQQVTVGTVTAHEHSHQLMVQGVAGNAVGDLMKFFSAPVGSG